jgi:hypothetical protein
MGTGTSRTKVFSLVQFISEKDQLTSSGAMKGLLRDAREVATMLDFPTWKAAAEKRVVNRKTVRHTLIAYCQQQQIRLIAPLLHLHILTCPSQHDPNRQQDPNRIPTG